VRGITARRLLLVDGVPMPATLINHYGSLDNIPLSNVERLEIVRGPASSIYGPDAVGGRINIVTKTGRFDSLFEAGVGGGSFDTQDAWLVGGKHFDVAALSFSLAARRTDNTDAFIERDAQSDLDARLRTNASRAPARMPAHRDVFEARLEGRYRDFALALVYSDQYNWQPGVGLAQAIDPNGTADSSLVGGTLTYATSLGEHVDVSAVFDYSRVRQTTDTTLYPPGAFAGAFPDGVRAAYDIYNDRYRLESSALITAWPRHALRVGLGAVENDFHTALDARNFIIANGRLIPTGTFGHLGGVNDRISIGDVMQQQAYLYVQDEWTFIDDWHLTAGARVDDYSDFGSSVNPRVALTWTPSQALSIKAMYGRAFRPPSLLESYSNGIYAALGDEDLKPTTLDMIQLSAEHITDTHNVRLTLFKYKQDDLIQIVPNAQSPRGTAYVNQGEQRGEGLELEFAQKVGETLQLGGGYAYQRRTDDDTDNNANIRFAPKHFGVLSIDWEPIRHWHGRIAARGIFDRERPVRDPRPVAENYVLTDLVFRRTALFDRLDVTLTIRNVFDEDARVQSATATNIPGDLPLPGRSALFSIAGRY